MTAYATARMIVRMGAVGLVAVIAAARTLSARMGSKSKPFNVIVSDSFKPQPNVYIA